MWNCQETSMIWQFKLKLFDPVAHVLNDDVFDIGQFLLTFSSFVIAQPVFLMESFMYSELIWNPSEIFRLNRVSEYPFLGARKTFF